MARSPQQDQAARRARRSVLLGLLLGAVALAFFVATLLMARHG